MKDSRNETIQRLFDEAQELARDMVANADHIEPISEVILAAAHLHRAWECSDGD